MTANVDLLSLPDKVEVNKHLPTGVIIYAYGAAEMHAYARANVAHATAKLHRQFGCELQDPNGTIWDHAAKLQAEIEALRADVASSKAQSMHNLALVERLLAAKRIDHAAAVDRMLQAEARAERLAEALRDSSDALERLAFAIRAPNAHTPQLVELAIAMRAAAQENDDA